MLYFIFILIIIGIIIKYYSNDNIINQNNIYYPDIITSDYHRFENTNNLNLGRTCDSSSDDDTNNNITNNTNNTNNNTNDNNNTNNNDSLNSIYNDNNDNNNSDDENDNTLIQPYFIK